MALLVSSAKSLWSAYEMDSLFIKKQKTKKKLPNSVPPWKKCQSRHHFFLSYRQCGQRLGQLPPASLNQLLFFTFHHTANKDAVNQTKHTDTWFTAVFSTVILASKLNTIFSHVAFLPTSTRHPLTLRFQMLRPLCWYLHFALRVWALVCCPQQLQNHSCARSLTH